MIIWLILIDVALVNLWTLLGENWCWSLLGLKGLKTTFARKIDWEGRLGTEALPAPKWSLYLAKTYSVFIQWNIFKVLSHSTIYHLACTSKFWVCGWNPVVLPFNWNVVSSTFTCYYLKACSFKFWVCGWNPMVWLFNWNVFSSTFTLYYKHVVLSFKSLDDVLWCDHLNY